MNARKPQAASLQPTTPFPTYPVDYSVATYALLPGEWVWTRSGPREVLSVLPGPAGGWREVGFEDGAASVVYTHPWISATLCSANAGGDPASGCDRWADEGSDFCAEHEDD